MTAEPTPKVLCVEDDPIMTMVLAYNLEKVGFSVMTAEDGYTALAQLERSQPQLVILDWVIPKLSGLQVLKCIRGSVKLERLPVLMVTGRSEQKDRLLALQYGATAFFVKPFSIAELIAAATRQVRLGALNVGVVS